MESRKTAWLCWGVGLLWATALFLFLWRFTDIHYALNDDSLLVRALLGCEGGRSTTFSPLVQGLLWWPLHWLTLAFPGISWFSWLQIGLLYLSQAVLVKSGMQCSLRSTGSALGGLALGLLFSLVYTVEFSTSITFTTTAAVLCTASIFQLATVHFTRPRFGGPLVFSFVLLLLAYALRHTAALPALLFWLVTLGYSLYTQQQQSPLPWRSIARWVLLCGGLLAACQGLQLADIALQQQQDALALNRARSRVMDYGGLGEPDPQLLAQLGWSQEAFDAVAAWYFMDESMSTQAFTTIAEFKAQGEKPLGLLDSLRQANRALHGLFAKSSNAQDFFLLCLGLTALSLLQALARGKPFSTLFPLISLGGAGLSLVYLGVQGRLPLRAATAILLPWAATLLCGLLYQHTPLRQWKRPWGLASLPVAALCLALSFTSAHTAFGFYYQPWAYGQPKEASLYHQLDAYALTCQDTLLVCDWPLNQDRRLWPDMSEGVPPNLLQLSWAQGSAGYSNQLRRYGLDADSFTIRQLLQPNVRVVTAGDPPRQVLMAYLQAECKSPVSALEEHRQEGFAVYRLVAESSLPPSPS